MKTSWRGAVLKNVQTEGEQSALGLDAIRGVVMLEVKAGSEAAALGLREGDVVLEVDGTPVRHVRHLLELLERRTERSKVLRIWRHQQMHTLTLR